MEAVVIYYSTEMILQADKGFCALWLMASQIVMIEQILKWVMDTTDNWAYLE